MTTVFTVLKLFCGVLFVSYIFLDGDGIIQLIWGKGDFIRGKVIVMLIMPASIVRN